MRYPRSQKRGRLIRLLAVFVAVLWLCEALHGVFHHHDSSDIWGHSCLLCLFLGSITACAASQALVVFLLISAASLQAIFLVPSLGVWRCERLRGPPIFA